MDCAYSIFSIDSSLSHKAVCPVCGGADFYIMLPIGEDYFYYLPFSSKNDILIGVTEEVTPKLPPRRYM